MPIEQTKSTWLIGVYCMINHASRNNQSLRQHLPHTSRWLLRAIQKAARGPQNAFLTTPALIPRHTRSHRHTTTMGCMSSKESETIGVPYRRTNAHHQAPERIGYRSDLGPRGDRRPPRNTWAPGDMEPDGREFGRTGFAQATHGVPEAFEMRQGPEHRGRHRH